MTTQEDADNGRAFAETHFAVLQKFAKRNMLAMFAPMNALPTTAQPEEIERLVTFCSSAAANECSRDLAERGIVDTAPHLTAFLEAFSSRLRELLS